MNSQIARFGLAAVALCGLVLAGCNAVEDVREDPYIATPAQTVALNGIIYGLGSKRAVTLQNTSGNAVTVLPFVAPAPTVPTAASITPFTFGPVVVGSPYKIEVKSQPYGKKCVAANNEGTITTQSALGITITCTDITNVSDPAYAPR
jgi:hypothetical protein